MQSGRRCSRPQSPRTGARRFCGQSSGTADQLYLAVRLAICEMVLPVEQNAPLILDDALLTFDDERLHKTLDYLVQLGSRRQILLFSCQSREVDYLTGRSGVHILNLQ